MNAPIKKTLNEWFPVIYESGPFETESDYEVLNRFANYYVTHFEDERSGEILKIINLLYLNGNLHTRNAISNEFFAIISNGLNADDLKTTLKKFPKDLKPVFIQTILEN